MTANEIRALSIGPEEGYRNQMLQEIAAQLADLIELLQSGMVVVKTRDS